MNITITFDITQRLCAAIRAIVDAERPRVQALAVQDSEPESAVESTEPERATEAQAEAEEPKKRKSRAKKHHLIAEPRLRYQMVTIRHQLAMQNPNRKPRKIRAHRSPLQSPPRGPRPRQKRT